MDITCMHRARWMVPLHVRVHVHYLVINMLEIAGVNGQNSKGMCQGGKPGTGKCILMYVYVAPPTPVGVWSMVLGLRQRIEYYYYPE